MADTVKITPLMLAKAEEIRQSLESRALSPDELGSVTGGVAAAADSRVIHIAGYALRTVADVDNFVYSYVAALESRFPKAVVSSMLFNWFPDSFMIEEYEANGLGGLHTFFCMRLFEPQE